MIASKKSHQNPSDYNQFSLKKIFEVNIKQFFSSEKIRNSGNCHYGHAQSFLGVDSKAYFVFALWQLASLEGYFFICKY